MNGTILRYFLSLILATFLFSASFAAETETVDTGKVNAQLVSSHDDVAPGQDLHIALRTLMDPEWHVYWLNPGDSGEPVQIRWNIPDELSAGDIVWPLPDAIPTGPLLNYGFENEVFFPVPFKVSESARPGDVLTVTADVFYLVCKDICIPEDTELSLSLVVGEAAADPVWGEVIEDALENAPKAGPASGGIVYEDGQVAFRLVDLPEGDFSKAHFFPESGGMVTHAAPQIVTQTDQGLQLQTEAGFEWEDGKPEHGRGVLAYNDGRVLAYNDGRKHTGIWVDLDMDSAPNIGAAIIAASPEGTETSSTGGADSSVISAVPSVGFWGAIIGALLGGLILNIMPCVFPIVSLKALSVAKSGGGDLSVIRRDAWAYTMGVLLSFLVLAAALIALKAGGASVGWAFHLQNPKVVALLAILLFAIGLNLLGVFEIAGSFQNVGQGLTQKRGLTGSFFTGVLAVIVATPCMAPFMASAVGYAMTQPAVTALTVFSMLGLGFALPYLLIAYIPAISRALPKPGDWMVRFKEFLAFPMFAAAIWLVWVVNHQTGPKGLYLVLGAMLLLAFAIWLFKRRPVFAKALAGISILAGAALVLTMHPKQTSVQGEAWSAEKVETLRASGKSVFVDFTAAWCVPCQINDAAVLKHDDILQDFADNNTAFLVADWTNYDSDIGKELEKYGRAGVPLYLLFPAYKADGSNKDVSPVILSQLLSKSEVREALQGINQ